MEHNMIGATVLTRDGHETGKVSRVAMDPTSRKVTHLIVHQGRMMGRYVVVPMTTITQVEEGHIHIDVAEGDMHRLPDFRETDFLPPEEGWEYPLAYPPGGVIWPMSMSWAGASTYPILSNAIVKENIPDEDVTIDAGTSVECVDGHCGRIDRVIVDDDSQAVVGFVIRKGFLFTQDIHATMDWVDHIDASGVHLKLRKDEVAERGAH
jgi:sporulation protein YlmC with PRC-barrel domain